MPHIIVLGAGRVGKAIAIDLAQQHSITVVDIDQRILDDVVNSEQRINTIQADLHNESLLTNIVEPADLIVNAVPGFMGFQTLQCIIRNNKNVVDIAFFPENALDLDKMAKQHNVTAIVDMGVAPGLSNLVLGHHSEDMQVEQFHCMVGGLPVNPQPPFNYKAPFSPIDVVEEYTRPARIVVNGKQITRPALSDVELVEFDNIGTLEAFNTDGLRSLLFSFPDIPNMVEKTIRYPGHAALIATLRDIGFFDEQPLTETDSNVRPLDVTLALLKNHWQLDATEKEFTIMKIVIAGKKQGQPIHYQYDLYDEYDEVTHTTSMARTTGYACTAAANLILENRYQTKGISPPERLGKDPSCFKFMLDYLTKRNITFNVQPR